MSDYLPASKNPLRSPLRSLSVELMKGIDSIHDMVESGPVNSRESAALCRHVQDALDRYKAVRFDGEVQSIMAREGLVG